MILQMNWMEFLENWRLRVIFLQCLTSLLYAPTRKPAFDWVVENSLSSFDLIGPGTFSFFLLASLALLFIVANPHNTRVFIDDKDLQGSGGDGYKNYGIDDKVGAIVIVRPDGYVGMISPLDKINDINLYFHSFAISQEDSSKI